MSFMLRKKFPPFLILTLLVLTAAAAADVKIIGGVNHSLNGFVWALYEEEVGVEGSLALSSTCKDNRYLTYCALGPDHPVASKMMPGQPYGRDCEKIYGCKS